MTSKIIESLFNHVVYQDFSNSSLYLREGKKISINLLNKHNIKSFYNYYQDFIRSNLKEFTDKPFLILTGCGSIPQLEKMRLQENDIDLLNKQGLDIFLFEDLQIGYGKKK